MAYRIAWSFLIMATLFGVPAAFGQGGSSPQQPVRLAAAQPQDKAVAQFYAACGKDVRRFCNGVQPGGGRILRCFRAHRDELSASCQSLFIQMGQRAAQKNTPTMRSPSQHPPTPPDAPADMPQTGPADMPQVAPADMPQVAPPPGDQYGVPSDQSGDE
jgi:Cysteine rich repeat